MKPLPRWSDVLTPAEAERFAALRLRAEMRRLARLDRKLDGIARRMAVLAGERRRGAGKGPVP